VPVVLLQGAKPLVYHADDLILIIKAAGTAGDTALIADAWARLQRDVQQKPTTAASSSGYQSTAQSNSNVDQKTGKPSPAAFKAVVKAYVDCKDFGKVLQLIADLEKVYGNTRATSVYGGLSFLPIDELRKEEDIAAVFTQLKARKVCVILFGVCEFCGLCDYEVHFAAMLSAAESCGPALLWLRASGAVMLAGCELFAGEKHMQTASITICSGIAMVYSQVVLLSSFIGSGLYCCPMPLQSLEST
jgi:hypothetical protein